MALKKNLTKTEFDALPDVLKAEYKQNGEGYSLDVDGEEDVGALKRAKEHEKEEKKKAKAEADEAKRLLAEKEEELARKTGNVEDLDKSWQAKLATKESEMKAEKEKLAKQVQTLLVDNVAISLANELSKTSAKVLLPHITPRLTVDMDGDKPTTRILDAEGKISALTLDDLKKEFRDNKDFSAIITQTNASGSSKADDKPNKQLSGGAAQKPDKPLVDMKPDELAAYITAKQGA